MFQDNIKDEVLSGEPLYTIRDSSGNVLNDNVDISLKTPIIQEGTPVNQALFRNLQGDLYTQYRYNVPEISQSGNNYIMSLDIPLTSYENGKIVNIEGGKYQLSGENIYTTDIIPKTWTELKIGTSYIASDGTKLTASDVYTTPTGSANLACDGDTTTYWYGKSSTAGWLKLEFPNGIEITKMKVQIGNIGSATNGGVATIQGSKDNISWTDLASTTTRTLQELTLSNTDVYRYYRIYCTFTKALNASVYEWQVSEWKEVINKFTNPYLNINNLGAKRINGTIKYGEKYTLVYNGETWDITSKIFVVGSFSKPSDSNSQAVVSLGFRPKLVITYSSMNNDNKVSDNAGGTPGYGSIPRILTDAYSDKSGKITDDGFTFSGYSNKTSTVHYIAIG